MKLNKENKRGISLIVLVITIIVMIILAAAIILSLNSSGIIGKANEATSASDAANLKEAAAVKLAEYELAKQLGELEDPDQTASEYVKEKLSGEMDTSGLAITADGEILTGLTAIAVEFAEAGVEIGAEVTGYTLNSATTAKTYTTSGNENTCDPDNYTETDPQLASLTRDESITWKYFGIDEKGEATIVGSITSSSPKMTLGGKGGYLNGPQELKDACKAMYSSSMGTARSITIEDVTRVLEYTGERGSYINQNEDYKEIDKALKISEIAKLLSYDMNNFAEASLESGKTKGDYEGNYYDINKTSEMAKYNTQMTDLIYPSTGMIYWLSSQCNDANFYYGCSYFKVRSVYSDYVGACNLYGTDGFSEANSCTIRPIISLSSNINMSYENEVVTISLN